VGVWTSHLGDMRRAPVDRARLRRGQPVDQSSRSISDRLDLPLRFLLSMAGEEEDQRKRRRQRY
jgi:hypothetical protein